MDKAKALDIAITAMFREILREDDETESVAPFPRCVRCDPRKYPLCLRRGVCRQAELSAEDPNPRPQFDFDESTCEHDGLVIDRSVCPIHGPGNMGPAPTAEELDDITGATAEEGNPLIAKARRVRKQREQRERAQGLYPEDIPLSGLAGPIDDPPPPVV